MRFLAMSLMYATALAYPFPRPAEVQMGGGVTITLHGIVKDGGGAPISGAGVLVSRGSRVYPTNLTDVTARDGSFAVVDKFSRVGGGEVTLTYRYSVEKEGYPSAHDVVVIKRYQRGSLIVTHDLGTITLGAKAPQGGDVSITLHGLVKDKGGAAISGAQLVFITNFGKPNTPKKDTVLSARDGGFSLVEKFTTAAGGDKVYTYPYTVEKAGYVAVADTVVLKTNQQGKLELVHDMKTITLIPEEKTALRRGSFSMGVGDTRQVSEAVFTVSGRMVSPDAGGAARSAKFQWLIQRSADNQCQISVSRTRVKR